LYRRYVDAGKQDIEEDKSANVNGLAISRKVEVAVDGLIVFRQEGGVYQMRPDFECECREEERQNGANDWNSDSDRKKDHTSRQRCTSVDHCTNAYNACRASLVAKLSMVRMSFIHAAVSTKTVSFNMLLSSNMAVGVPLTLAILCP
jgi:hypothetical protein